MKKKLQLAIVPITNVRRHQVYEHQKFGEPIAIVSEPYIIDDCAWVQICGVGGGTGVIPETLDFVQQQKLIGALGITHEMRVNGIVLTDVDSDSLNVYETPTGELVSDTKPENGKFAGKIGVHFEVLPVLFNTKEN